MKNNKGFTLVELLAVIVILVAIISIAIPSITSSVDRTKDKEFKAKTELIVAAAEVYVSNHRNAITKTECYITIDQLINDGVIASKNVVDPRKTNDAKITGCVKYASQNYEYGETCINTNLCVE